MVGQLLLLLENELWKILREKEIYR